MISFHPLSEGAPQGTIFTRGFRYASGVDDLSRIAQAISRFTWAPAAFRDGYRREENFLFAEVAALDFDSGEMTLEEAVNTFCDCRHIIGTTRSHQVSKKGEAPRDRFRVLLQLEELVTDLADYRYTLAGLVRAYPADQAPKDGARFFFPCQKIVSVSNDGYLEPVRRVDKERLKRHVATRRQAGVVSNFVQWALTNEVPTGARNTTFYRVAKDLLRLGKTEDEALEAILASATYEKTPATTELVRELAAALKSAAKGLAREEIKP